MKRIFLTMIALFMLSATGANAQSKVRYTDCAGNSTAIEAYTTVERDALGLMPSKGKTIFNISTQKVETCNGNRWVGTGDPPEEEILFTINTTDEKYYIPTSGYVGGTYNHAYKWDISVDNVVVKANEAGTGSESNGIPLSLTNGTHQIRITPADSPAPGWGNAFGHNGIVSGGDDSANKGKLISIDAPLTTLAFAPKISENPTGTNASNMFAYMFYNCTNLTTGAKIVDTYQLPEEVTDLSNFLNATHAGNMNLETPIDLSGLKEWLSNNQKIDNLSVFLYGTHSGNTSIEDPIDISHLSGWFEKNTSITNLLGFLLSTHSNNTSLDLKGQKIFPEWIKKLEDGSGTPIKDVNSAFERMFSCEQEKSGDTGEPTFENGDPLSSLGKPNYNSRTYTNRNISPVNDNWK
ncbi:MAG: hypothetical protein LBS54_05780 [Dysgonamonadaceae bacterium]|jgi:hypothetical protein|nr:hypothetical protein [Dysgonamonadaceae bacterium]